MKNRIIAGMLVAIGLLAGCNEAQQKELDSQVVLCRQEVQALQKKLEQANDMIAKQDRQITGLQEQVQEVNRTALESIQTMMQKQNEKDIELKNKLKASQEQVKQLRQKISEMQAAAGGEM